MICSSNWLKSYKMTNIKMWKDPAWSLKTKQTMIHFDEGLQREGHEEQKWPSSS